MRWAGIAVGCESGPAVEVLTASQFPDSQFLCLPGIGKVRKGKKFGFGREERNGWTIRVTASCASARLGLE